MARLNISIPDELRQRMEGLNCNWSSLAQEAFALAVEIEELKAAGNDLEAGLARLRADKGQHSEREHADGFAHGMNWALETAKFEELSTLAGATELFTQPELAVQKVNELCDNSSFDLPGMPKSCVSEAYALGFLKGAADIFSKI